MAQSGTLLVDADEVGQRAKTIDLLARSMDGPDLALRQIDEMEAYWHGDQHDRFVREYQSDIEMLAKAVRDLRTFTNQLMQAADIYREMTPEVQNVIDAMHKGA